MMIMQSTVADHRPCALDPLVRFADHDRPRWKVAHHVLDRMDAGCLSGVAASTRELLAHLWICGTARPRSGIHMKVTTNWGLSQTSQRDRRVGRDFASGKARRWIFSSGSVSTPGASLIACQISRLSPLRVVGNASLQLGLILLPQLNHPIGHLLLPVMSHRD